MSTTVPELKENHNSSSRPGTPVEDKVPSLHDSNNDTVVEDGQSQIEIEPRSKGVIEMEALRERINVKYLCLLYGTFALLAYVLSLSEYQLSQCAPVIYPVLTYRPIHLEQYSRCGPISFFPNALYASYNRYRHRCLPGCLPATDR